MGLLLIVNRCASPVRLSVSLSSSSSREPAIELVCVDHRVSVLLITLRRGGWKRVWTSNLCTVLSFCREKSCNGRFDELFNVLMAVDFDI